MSGWPFTFLMRMKWYIWVLCPPSSSMETMSGVGSTTSNSSIVEDGTMPMALISLVKE